MLSVIIFLTKPTSPPSVKIDSIGFWVFAELGMCRFSGLRIFEMPRFSNSFLKNGGLHIIKSY